MGPGTSVSTQCKYLLREAFRKKTAIIVTLSLPGGRGVSQNPYNKGGYYRDI